MAKALAKDPNHRMSRVFDLLPPEDAPHVPDVRIIGDGKRGTTAAASPRDEAAGRPVQDDVLRIEAEDSVFYIGPDTTPARPQVRNVVAERIRANWEALRRAPGTPSPPAPPRQHQAARLPVTPVAHGAIQQGFIARPQPNQPTRRVAAPPPEPPPVASARVRTAELAGSMLWAAPLLAL